MCRKRIRSGLSKPFIDELDLEALGFAGVVPEPTGRPAFTRRRC
jgi:hypothetical protein